MHIAFVTLSLLIVMTNNPYQTPSSIQLAANNRQTKHRSFRLTVEAENPNFKIGTLGQAILFTLIQQLPILILTALLLDGGSLFRIAAISSATFWGTFIVVMIQSRSSVNDADVLLIKWSYWPLMLIVYNVHLILSVLLR